MHIEKIRDVAHCSVRAAPSPPPAPAEAAETTAPVETDAVKVSLRGALAGKKLRRIDSDKDGQLSLSELEAAKERITAAGGKTKFIDKVIENYGRLDADGDGTLKFCEVKRSIVARLRRSDDTVAAPEEPAVDEPVVTDPVVSAPEEETTLPSDGEVVPPVLTEPVVVDVLDPVIDTPI